MMFVNMKLEKELFYYGIPKVDERGHADEKFDINDHIFRIGSPGLRKVLSEKFDVLA